MLDEAQDADPVTLGLLERNRGARIIVGDKLEVRLRLGGEAIGIGSIPRESRPINTSLIGQDAPDFRRPLF